MTQIPSDGYKEILERLCPSEGIRVCPECLREVPAAEMLPQYQCGSKSRVPDRFVCMACHYKWMMVKAQVKYLERAKENASRQLRRMKTATRVDFVGFVAAAVKRFGGTETAGQFLAKHILAAAERKQGAGSKTVIDGMAVMAKLIHAANEYQDRRVSAEDISDDDLQKIMDAHVETCLRTLMDDSQQDEQILRLTGNG